jgi:hypothetical protein
VKSVVTLVLAALIPLASSCAKNIKVGPEDARVIASEAYIYGLPIVDNYRVMYAFAVYRQSGSYKAPFNHLAVVMPDAAQPDSARALMLLQPPYALSWLDLRKEPAVVTVPAMKENRTFRVQLIDLYTHYFDELGTHATGNAGGAYMIVAGPWAGDGPPGVTKVIPCETAFALAIFRVAAPEGSADVTEQLLTSFSVETLSEFNGEKPKTPDALIFPPYSRETAQSAGFFQYLNFVLQFCPVHPSEVETRARFARLGIAGGRHFALATMNRDIRGAIDEGMSDARVTLAAAIANTPEGSARYGTRAHLENDYLARAAAAKIRLYGPRSP